LVDAVYGSNDYLFSVINEILGTCYGQNADLTAAEGGTYTYHWAINH